ncbi:zinc finger protein 805-like [Mizuhopecten yessoensis]|nr:zinc finger protein 805-like [Mizuhopecten yessoensis]
MAHANLFTDIEELKAWAGNLDILHFPTIQARIEDMEALEEAPMGSQVIDEVISAHLHDLNNADDVKEWASNNHLQTNEMVKKRLGELKVYHCEYCTQVFNKRSHIARHIQNVHEKKTLPCIKCEKNFSSNYNRLRHQPVCTGPSLMMRTYSCHKCKATFVNIKQVKQHSRFHIDETDHATKRRRVNDTDGDTSFETTPGPSSDERTSSSIPTPGPSSDVGTHINPTPGTSDSAKSYTCRMCKARFTNRKSLYVHHMRHKQEGSGLKLQPVPFSEDQLRGGKITKRMKL